MMDERPTQDLLTRAFQKRVLDEFAAMRAEQAELRKDVGQVRSDVKELRSDVNQLRSDVNELRSDVNELRTQQAAMARNIGTIDQRLTTLEQRVDERLQETRPIWEAVQIQIQRLGEKLDTVFEDFYDLRSELKLHGRRLAELERRVLS